MFTYFAVPTCPSVPLSLAVLTVLTVLCLFEYGIEKTDPVVFWQYARYFGGDLKLISMEGYGTDVYIHLNRLSSSREPLQ